MPATISKSVLLCLILLLPALTLSQDSASLTGTIRDQSGAVIRGATVHINNTATGLERDLKSNDDGEYLAAVLPPGRYIISVMAQGFRRYQANDVILRVAQNARMT